MFDRKELRLPVCDVIFCGRIALGGKCNWKAVFFQGCGRRLCLEHRHMDKSSDSHIRCSDDIMEVSCNDCKWKATFAKDMTKILIILVFTVLFVFALGCSTDFDVKHYTEDVYEDEV